MLFDYAYTPLFIFILIKIASSEIGSKEEEREFKLDCECGLMAS